MIHRAGKRLWVMLLHWQKQNLKKVIDNPKNLCFLKNKMPKQIVHK